MFQLRSHLVTLQHGINLVRIDILSILNWVLVISSQNLKLALLKPSDLKLFLTKLENQLLSHSQLALPQWKGEDIQYVTCISLWNFDPFMFSDTLYVVLHIPLFDKLLQFNLYRIHNIPVVHPVLKKLFKYSIQEEYLAIRSDSQFISFPPSDDIMACQVSNGQFCHINSPVYATDTSKSCSNALFLKDKVKIDNVCIVSVINQTQDGALNINDNFWVISTLQDKRKLCITCLQSQLCHQAPLPILHNLFSWWLWDQYNSFCTTIWILH